MMKLKSFFYMKAIIVATLLLYYTTIHASVENYVLKLQYDQEIEITTLDCQSPQRSEETLALEDEAGTVSEDEDVIMFNGVNLHHLSHSDSNAQSEHYLLFLASRSVPDGSAHTPYHHYMLTIGNDDYPVLEYYEDQILQRFPQLPEQRVNEIVLAVYEAADQHGLDPALLFSVIATESSFRPMAESHAGAHGLMQVIPYWHQDKMRVLGIHENDLYDIEANIALGAWILRDYIDKSQGNIERGLQRYNGSASDPSRQYTQAVYRHYRSMFGSS